MNSFSQLFQEVPDFGEILFYAVIVAVMVIGVVFGRFLIRGLVNRRVRSIHAEGLDLGDLSTMGKKGLLTDEELKKIRRRFAEQQLQQTKAEKAGIKAKDLLLAIEADPSRATSLLPPSSEHAKRALEGLKAGSSRSVEDQLRAQLGEAAPPPRAQPTAPPPPPTSMPSPQRTPATRPPAPLPSAPPAPPASPPSPAPSPPRPAPAAHSPRPAPDQPPPPAIPPSAGPAPAAASGGAAMDLDGMLAKGLISRREYDLLMARVKKAEGR